MITGDCVNLRGAIAHFFQNIIERFPASLIKEPTAFTSNGPTELYNNILVFIVDGGAGSRSEMHIFQVSALIRVVNVLRDICDCALRLHHVFSPIHRLFAHFIFLPAIVSKHIGHSSS